MKMGRERDILRWDIHSSLIRDRIAAVESTLASLQQVSAGSNQERASSLRAELVGLRQRLAALGPSPRARMG